MTVKQALSVTLDADNVTWLKGRMGAGGARSVSDLLDQIVTAARKAGGVGPSRSVVGTVDIDSSDPLLKSADAAVQALYARSLGRPLVARETGARYSAAAPRRTPARKRRG